MAIFNKENIAIIDATPITHTRPVGGELYKLNPELSPKNDAIKLQKLYQDINISRVFTLTNLKYFQKLQKVKDWEGYRRLLKGNIKEL